MKKIFLASAIALSILNLQGCQVNNELTIFHEPQNVKEDTALYNQIKLFTQTNGGIPQKDKDGFTLYTPFFNENMIEVSVSEKDYLQKVSMFINNETIKSVQVIGYIPSSSYEPKMANILESIEKLFKVSGVIAPIKLTIASPTHSGVQEKRFEIRVITN